MIRKSCFVILSTGNIAADILPNPISFCVGMPIIIKTITVFIHSCGIQIGHIVIYNKSNKCKISCFSFFSMFKGIYSAIIIFNTNFHELIKNFLQNTSQPKQNSLFCISMDNN